MNIAIIFAGGTGTRMGVATPKQFLELAGKPVLVHVLELFEKHPLVDALYLVTLRDYFGRVEKLAHQYGITKLRGIVEGGTSAQESIYAGLKFVSSRESAESVVLLQDGVRPYVLPEVITANIEAVKKYGNAITYTPCYETVVLSEDGVMVKAIPPRRMSYTAQAPQSFRLGDILLAHEKIRKYPEGYTDLVDQASICFKLNIPIHLVLGNRGNVKITTGEDLVILEALINWQAQATNLT